MKLKIGMRSKLAGAAIAISVVSAASGAIAANGWTTFATGSDSGQYGAFATANANVVAPGALAIESSEAADVTWSIDCNGETKLAKPNEVISMTVAAAQTCDANGTANTTQPGTIRVELMKR